MTQKEAPTTAYGGHGLSFFTRNRSWISRAPYVQRSPVSCYTPARLANVHYTSARVNYKLYGRSCQKMTYIRSGLRERASTSVALAPGSPLCRVTEREMVGPSWKKKRVRRSPASFARQNSRARSHYIVRKPWERDRAVLCVHRKFLC